HTFTFQYCAIPNGTCIANGRRSRVSTSVLPMKIAAVFFVFRRGEKRRNQVIAKLFCVCFRQRGGGLTEYVTPTRRRPDISIAKPNFVIEWLLISCAFDSQ